MSKNLSDDFVAALVVGKGKVRGRIVRLGASLNAALGEERYPPAVARILGEAALISALVARTLKFDGKLLVQAHGTNEGAISMLAAECTTAGNIRAYARFDPPSLARILADNPQPDAHVLMGGGTFAMTIDQGAKTDRYQGMSTVEEGSLGASAQHYFAQSEQIPTRFKLSVGQIQTGDGASTWRGGGLMVQRIAGDTARTDVSQSWTMAKAVMGTLGDAEMLDPDLSSENLLYRLFHEQGVSMLEKKQVLARCSCSRERLLATIKSFDNQAQKDMFVDGKITANCEFCGTDYVFLPADIEA